MKTSSGAGFIKKHSGANVGYMVPGYLMGPSRKSKYRMGQGPREDLRHKEGIVIVIMDKFVNMVVRDRVGLGVITDSAGL